MTWGRDFSTQPCDVRAVQSSPHTLDLICASELHLAYGLTAPPPPPPPCRFTLCTEPGRASLWPYAVSRGGLYHWWVTAWRKHILVCMCEKLLFLTSVCSHHGRLLNHFADQRREPVRDQQLPVTGAADVWSPRFSGFISSAVSLPFYW